MLIVDVVVCFLLVSLGRNRNSSWELEIDDVAVAMVMFCATPIRRTGTNAATINNRHQTPNQITVARKIRSNQSWLWNYFTKDLLMLLLHHTKERRP